MKCFYCKITESVKKENDNYCPKCGRLRRVVRKIIELPSLEKLDKQFKEIIENQNKILKRCAGE